MSNLWNDLLKLDTSTFNQEMIFKAYGRSADLSDMLSFAYAVHHKYSGYIEIDAALCEWGEVIYAEHMYRVVLADIALALEANESGLFNAQDIIIRVVSLCGHAELVACKICEYVWHMKGCLPESLADELDALHNAAVKTWGSHMAGDVPFKCCFRAEDYFTVLESHYGDVKVDPLRQVPNG